MGSLCQKAPPQLEPELELPNRANADLSPDKGELAADLERQFIKLFDEIPIPEGPLKDTIFKLRPFDFDSTKDASILTIVKANEQVPGESYFGFW